MVFTKLKNPFSGQTMRYEKIIKSKIVHLKQIYKFGFDHYSEKRAVFILIKKTPFKIKSCGFRPNNARCEKVLRSKIVHLKTNKSCSF